MGKEQKRRKESNKMWISMMVHGQLEFNAILGSGIQYSTPQGYTALGQSGLLPVSLMKTLKKF